MYTYPVGPLAPLQHQVFQKANFPHPQYMPMNPVIVPSDFPVDPNGWRIEYNPAMNVVLPDQFGYHGLPNEMQASQDASPGYRAGGGEFPTSSAQPSGRRDRKRRNNNRAPNANLNMAETDRTDLNDVIRRDNRLRKKVMYSSSVSPTDDFVNPNQITRDQLVAVDPVRYKTKLCVSWEKEGRCSYKSKCLFAHGPHELRSHEWNWELLQAQGKSDVVQQYDPETVCKGGTPYPKKPFATLQNYTDEYVQLMDKYGESVASNVLGKAMEWVL